MALGNQFKDTYHYDDDGNLHIWSHPKSVAWENKFKQKYSQEPVHTVLVSEDDLQVQQETQMRLIMFSLDMC